MDYVPWLLAAAVGLAAYFALDLMVSFLRERKRRKTLVQFQNVEEAAAVKMGAGAYQIRAAFQSLSLDVAGRERAAVLVSSFLLGLLFSLGLAFFVSLPLAGGAGLLTGYLLVQNFIRSRWSKTRLAIEKEIPTFMRNLAGILQTEVNPLVATEKASLALVPEQPLKAWLDYYLDEKQAYGASSSSRLQEEASEISVSLGLLVFEIGRMAQTGGSGYARAFQDAANNLSLVLEVRAEAHTESKSALGLAKVIIAVAIGIDGFLVFNPSGIFATPETKIAMAVSAVWGVVGWLVIRRVVEEAVL